MFCRILARFHYEYLLLSFLNQQNLLLSSLIKAKTFADTNTTDKDGGSLFIIKNYND